MKVDVLVENVRFNVEITYVKEHGGYFKADCEPFNSAGNTPIIAIERIKSKLTKWLHCNDDAI